MEIEVLGSGRDFILWPPNSYDKGSIRQRNVKILFLLTLS